jgi:hypothetical protein
MHKALIVQTRLCVCSLCAAACVALACAPAPRAAWLGVARVCSERCAAAAAAAGILNALLHSSVLHRARREALLAQVRNVVAAHPRTMKYEARHAADGDYKADMMVGVRVAWPLGGDCGARRAARVVHVAGLDGTLHLAQPTTPPGTANHESR